MSTNELVNAFGEHKPFEFTHPVAAENQTFYLSQAGLAAARALNGGLRNITRTCVSQMSFDNHVGDVEAVIALQQTHAAFHTLCLELGKHNSMLVGYDPDKPGMMEGLMEAVTASVLGQLDNIGRHTKRSAAAGRAA